MKKLALFIILFGISTITICQTKNNRFAMEINYGLNGNFFVNSYDEVNNGPTNHTYFYNKNFLGTVAGIELSYNFNSYKSIFLGFSNSSNRGKKNYSGNFKGVDISIRDFHIFHQDQFYQLGYDGKLFKKKLNLRFNVGLLYLQSQIQTIGLENFDNFIEIDESNQRNSNSNEAGFFGGLSYSKKIDTKFDLGLKAKIYYLASVSSFEAITLTPTLSYHF